MSFVVRLLAWVVARFAFDGLRVPGTILGTLAGDALRIRRAHVESAMVRAGVTDARGEARAMYHALGRGALELLWLSAVTRDVRERRIRENVVLAPEALRAMDEALAAGPVVIGASHTGSWELVMLAAARVVRERGRRFAVVAKPISSPTWQTFMTRLRASAGVELVDPRRALTSVKQVLREGGVVVMPIDQVPDARRHALVASFLGAEALLDRAPAAIAARFGATFIVTAAHREGAMCHLEVLASMAPSTASRAGIVRRTREAAAALESFVVRHPASWLWLHRRWRAAREVPRTGAAFVSTAR